MPKIPAPKYTRDFYPADLALRRYITDTWRRVSELAGFEEYDGPIFELSELYEIKSGEGILSELFSFEDRGGRRMAIRPEMTPTLARMVNERINALPRPIKWFSIPNCCRAERGQKGRLREFWQWNVDIIGGEMLDLQALADAECIAIAINALLAFGLNQNDFKVRINHRGLMEKILQTCHFNEEQYNPIFNLLDSSFKFGTWDVFDVEAEKIGLDRGKVVALKSLLDADDMQRREKLRTMPSEHIKLIAERVDKVYDYLENMGLKDFVQPDPHIARGLAYYTGTIFEIFDTKGLHRAIAGGGRYDKLLGLLGGPPVSGVGFGMGDVVLGNLLEERGLLKDHTARLAAAGPEYFVIDIAQEGSDLPAVLNVVQQLRRAGHSAEFSYKRTGVGKGLKAANAAKAKYALMVSASSPTEIKLQCKDLSTGEQVAFSSLDEMMQK